MMVNMLTLYGYMKCGTCRKAIAWLDDRGIDCKFIDITQKPPPPEVLRMIVSQAEPVAYEVKHLYNTSGMQYRSLGIAEQRKTMSEAQQLALLAGNGMLVKRPIVTDGKRFTVGFKADVFERVWG